MPPVGVAQVTMSEYGYAVEVPEGYDEAVVRTRLALKGEGFSIITEMHVGEVLGSEGGDERQYLFMGAWTPDVVERNVAPEVRAAMHLPCNVVIQESGSAAIVAALDPGEDAGDPDGSVVSIIDTARAALERVLLRISDPAYG